MPFIKIICLAICLSFITGRNIYCQTNTKPGAVDSTKIYRRIEQISKQGKFSKWVYSLIFKPISTKPTTVKKKPKTPQQKIYSRLEGKIIRSIKFEALDPFGYNINDTASIPHDFLRSYLNKLHLKTKNITLRNLILIKVNQPFDSLRVKESERLIRSQLYIRDVLFKFKTTKTRQDSVDITISVLDNWSISGKVGFSLSQPSLNLKDQNFIGTGHSFQPNVKYNTITSTPSYLIDYTITNYKNTFITIIGSTNLNEDKSYVRFIGAERLFITPFIRWAGGISLRQQLRKDSINLTDTIKYLQPFKSFSQDLWLGRSWRVFHKISKNDQITNFVLAGRFLRNTYQQRPIASFDTLNIYSPEKFYFLGMGISTQKYIQDKYIFNYGFFEDVPVGSVYGITIGYQMQNNTGRLYTGGKISWGDYFNWGYLSSSIEYGNFFNGKKYEQGAINISTSYFTALFKTNGWSFRQFIKPSIIIGFKRYPSDTLSIINDIRRGGNIVNILGQHKILVTFQTQSYAPYSILGFHFGPYIMATLGTLGTEKSGFRFSHIYSLLGLGVLIKNEFLITNNFQISLSFYPPITGFDNKLFKLNAYKPSDYGFRSFDISKPQTVLYR